MRELYTTEEIIGAIRDMSAAQFGNGIIPTFNNSSCAHAMQVHSDTVVNYEYITDNKLNKIIAKNMKTPSKVLRLFEPNKRPVGRPSLGSKAKEATLQDKKAKP